jgi:pimeloyl-ACP methyl ester carboxylesterase
MLRWRTSLDSLTVGVVDTRLGPVEVARAGTGPAVVLVHGIPGSWRQLVPLAEDLSADFHLLMPSRPGYGATPLRVGHTADEQADALAGMLDAVGIDRCAVVGISGGGPSALALAVRHPDRVAGLVLGCALVAHLMEARKIPPLLRVPGLAEALTPVARFVAHRKLRRPEAVRAELRKGLTPDEHARSERDPRIVADIVRHFLSHHEAPGLAGLRNDYAQVALAREPVSPSVSCPVLVLHGDADTVVPVDHARFHAETLRGELVVFEQAGHLFLFTRRDESVTALRSFLASIA